MWMCSAEYGGEGGERRELNNNELDGSIPTELGSLTKLVDLCVRPASPCARW